MNFLQKVSEVEEAALVDALTESGRVRELDPKVAEAELKGMADDVVRYHKGEDVDISAIEDRIASIGNSFIGQRNIPGADGIINASDMMLQRIRERHAQLKKPRTLGDDPKL